MRYEGMLLTLAESHALIEEMNTWCRRTGTNYNKLVGLARVSATMRSSVKARGTAPKCDEGKPSRHQGNELPREELCYHDRAKAPCSRRDRTAPGQSRDVLLLRGSG
jgi:hypothetical protein